MVNFLPGSRRNMLIQRFHNLLFFLLSGKLLKDNCGSPSSILSFCCPEEFRHKGTEQYCSRHAAQADITRLLFLRGDDSWCIGTSSWCSAPFPGKAVSARSSKDLLASSSEQSHWLSKAVSTSSSKGLLLLSNPSSQSTHVLAAQNNGFTAIVCLSVSTAVRSGHLMTSRQPVASVCREIPVARETTHSSTSWSLDSPDYSVTIWVCTSG